MQSTAEASKVIECIMCKEKIVYIQSHNAQPVRNGRCCSVCNNGIVIPTRLTLAMSQNVKEGKGFKDGE